MDLLGVVGLLSSLIGIEEAVRSWCSLAKIKIKKSKLNLKNWDSDDLVVQRGLDSFKKSVRAQYKEHIFSEQEIEQIIKLFFEENTKIYLNYFQKKQLEQIIKDIMQKYNEFNMSLMSTGEKIIHSEIKTEMNKISEQLEEISNKEKNNNIRKFVEAVEISKSVGLANIDDLINGEYEINRNDFIEKMQQDNYRFISVQGPAGSGKSVLCKKYVQNEEYVLYTRAERIVQENNLNDIWNCDIEDVLEWISGKRIVFFIDALEFIADCSTNKIELLQRLYDVAAKYPNVYVITSCRTSDKNAFIKIQTKYEIKIYEVDDISKDEMVDIVKKYPVIKKMAELKKYSALLKSPFYINLIVSNAIDIDKIADEAAFRKKIWEEVICLEEKRKKYNIQSEDIIQSIETIVFRRAKEFSIGIYKGQIEQKILDVLISENVVVQRGDYIRLQYDIYEDICFEQYFDREFGRCKGEFKQFYGEITDLGRCVYRRYQIWISNKLFIQESREKFIYSLVFEKELPNEWKKQTIIGIVKSRYCNAFFDEYTISLIENNLLKEFIQITNLYAFDAKIYNQNDITYMILVPIGYARENIIMIIQENNLFQSGAIDKDDIIKLCSDYSKSVNRDDNVSFAACQIIEYYFEEKMKENSSELYYSADKELIPFLEIIYRMADASSDWLKKLFYEIEEYYKGSDRKKNRLAEDIMEWTMKNAYPCLVNHLAQELCNMANTLWVRNDSNRKERYHNERDAGYYYGLSKNADHYHFKYRNINDNVFLWNLFRINFNVGIMWAINFINKAMETYSLNKPDNIIDVDVRFVEKNEMRSYIGNPNFWLGGIKEYAVPEIIGDILYVLKKVIIETIEICKDDEMYLYRFSNYIRNKLYSKSNNIALLTIIEEVALHFQSELPGYGLDLASSIELIYCDHHRFGLYNKDATMLLLEQHILQSVGIQELKERYLLDEKCNLTLQQYVARTQLCFDGTVREHCYKILDDLYSRTDNDEEHACDYLQIQKMDMRNAKIKQINDNMCSLEPKITGEAEKIVQRNEEANVPQNKIAEVCSKLVDNVTNKEDNLKEILNAIDDIKEVKKQNSEVRFQYEQILNMLMAVALSKNELDRDRREDFCKIWIGGIERYFSHESFVVNLEFTTILFQQLEKDISQEIKNNIKLLILNSIFYRDENGLVDKIASYAKKYLSQNKNLANAVFNTVIRLAEDEMNHQKHNAEYLKKTGRDVEYEFNPNMQRKLHGVDRYIEEDDETCFVSQKEKIIDTYLFNEVDLELVNFDINSYDVGLLCYSANCGLGFDSEKFVCVIRSVLECMIQIWFAHKRDHDAHHIIDVYQKHEIIELYQKEMVQSDYEAEDVIDTLFDEIDFSLFTHDTIKFYQDIFGTFLCEFFDGHIDARRRNLCKSKIKYISNKIDVIECENVRVQLYKSVILSLTDYCHGDWSKIQTNYSYQDKMFLNRQFEKYGHYHVKDMLQTIYQLHMKELLPEILISVEKCFVRVSTADRKTFIKEIQKPKWIVDMLVLKAFTDYSDRIKEDQTLIKAFEGILETLIEINDEKAAVILDEFRVH